MPTTPAQLPIAELDYDQILSNLIAFMKDDPTFSDYDFTGSGLRLLSRVLAYVTFYNNYYVTAAVNESFLDTAQLRSSIVSHAKMLGYNAHGTQSAVITTNVTAIMTSSSATSVTLPKNTKFQLNDDTSYLFYTTDDTTLLQNTTTANNYEASDVLLVEGRPATFQFTVDVNDPTQRFIIPNANASFSHIGVVVQESATANTRTTFLQPTNLALVNDANAIFLVSEAYSGYPELTFGNGVIGKKLVHGNIVLVDYYISRGAAGNGIRGPFTINDASFTKSGLARGVTATIDADTVASYNGADAEDVDQIRYIAPLMYSAQNRCVTGEDYKALILAEYGDSIAAINVFGGEEGNPNDANERPAYGHVYIALKPKVGLRFTDSTHDIIMQTVVAPRQVIGVLPEIVIPDYVYVVVATKALYDTKATTRSKDALVDAIKTGISEYATTAVEKFDTAFRFSRLARAIDDTDPAISSSLTRVEIQKRIQPTLNASNSLTLKFGGPLLRTGTESVILPATQLTEHRFGYTAANGTSFTNCYFAEVNDVLQVVGLSNTATLVVVQDSIGTVNTTTGVVTIAGFIPTDIESDELDIRLNALPVRSDLVPSLNRLFTVDATSIRVDVADDAVTTAANDFYQGGVLR